MLTDSPTVAGEVSVTPRDASGAPLADPWVIFADPDFARRVLSLDSDGGIDLGKNMVVNLGRQTIANLIGGRASNANDWAVTKVSWGTYDEAPRFTDATLSPQPGVTVGGENEILYDGVNRRKAISSVDWPVPFIVRFECILGTTEANGQTIREMGLWTHNETLFARKTMVPVVKTSAYSLVMTWRVRC